jgi:hypothetical protein
MGMPDPNTTERQGLPENEEKLEYQSGLWQAKLTIHTNKYDVVHSLLLLVVEYSEYSFTTI